MIIIAIILSVSQVDYILTQTVDYVKYKIDDALHTKSKVPN